MADCNQLGIFTLDLSQKDSQVVSGARIISKLSSYAWCLLIVSEYPLQYNEEYLLIDMYYIYELYGDGKKKSSTTLTG